MKLLLDTHVLLWALTDSARLPSQARTLIESPDNEIYYSVVSPWEVDIKHTLHPTQLAINAKQLAAFCEQSGFLQLPIKKEHVFHLSQLKRRKGAEPHKDPFDRIMLCQAAVEDMLFLTHDARISEYTEPCIFAV